MTNEAAQKRNLLREAKYLGIPSADGVPESVEPDDIAVEEGENIYIVFQGVVIIGVVPVRPVGVVEKQSEQLFFPVWER